MFYFNEQTILIALVSVNSNNKMGMWTSPNEPA